MPPGPPWISGMVCGRRASCRRSILAWLCGASSPGENHDDPPASGAEGLNCETETPQQSPAAPEAPQEARAAAAGEGRGAVAQLLAVRLRQLDRGRPAL